MRAFRSSIMLMAMLAASPAFAQSRPAVAPLPEPRVRVVNPMPSVADLFACTRGSGTMVSAHRGGAGPGYPENALETAAHTLAQVPALIEFDVRTSRDGILVLMHDATLDRTTTGAGPVAAQDWTSLQALSLKDNDGQVTPFRIVRFTDAIAWARGRTLMIVEIKESAALPQAVREIQAARAQSFVMLELNSIEDAQTVQRLDPDIALTVEVGDTAGLDRLQASGLDLRHVVAWNGIGRRDRSLWQTIRTRGLTLAYGTMWYVDGTIENLGISGLYAELARDGVDLLATDRPVQAQAEIRTARSIEMALARCGALGQEQRR